MRYKLMVFVSLGVSLILTSIITPSAIKHLKLMFKHGSKNMRIKTKLSLNLYNLSKSFYIIVIILPLNLLVYCAAAQDSEAAAADSIKVMSINLLFSEIDDRNKRLKIIADYVAENDVDFVLLQEVVRGDLAKTDNSAKDLKDFIFKRHNLEYFVRTETETISIPFVSNFLRVGNAILSRYKIEYSDAKKLPKSSEIEVFGNYKLEFTRNVMMLRSTVNGFGAIHVYNTHLCAGCEIKEHEAQLDVLLQFVKKIERDITGENPVILGGDFNIDRIQKAGVENYLYEKVLLEGFIDAYAVAANDPLDELCEDKDNPDEHCTIGVTNLGDSNPGRVDYIFAKGFRKVTNSQIIFNSAITDDPAVSDHSAVSVSLVGNKLKPIPLSGVYTLILNDVEDNN
jgi:maltose 6'-phosphate phosphatase